METLSSLNSVLVDEVSLSGLEGCSLNALWKRLEARKTFRTPVTSAVQAFSWKVLVEKCTDLQFYHRDTPFEEFFIVGNSNPLKTVKDYHGYLPKVPFGSVSDSGVRGLCSSYKARKDVTSKLRCPETGVLLCSFEDATKQYGDCLVVVASQKLREAALWGKSDSLAPVNDRQFCILELIGRARDQGVTQRGVHSYFKLDPRSCFYDVRMLAKYKFITMQPFVNSPNERPGRVRTPMLLLARFDHRIYSSLDVAGEVMSRYLESQPGQQLAYVDHEWPEQVHPFLAQSCYYQLLLDGYWKMDTPVDKAKSRKLAKRRIGKRPDKEELDRVIRDRDGDVSNLKPPCEDDVQSEATSAKAQAGSGDNQESASDIITIDDDDKDLAGQKSLSASPSTGQAQPLSEQQRRLLRKPYNRPTASSVISLVKEFRAVTSPWVQGKEKVADANEEDEDAIVPAVAREANLELPLAPHIYWYVEQTGSDGALMADVCDSLIYQHDRSLKKKVQKKTTDRHWGCMEAVLKDMGRIRKHVLVANCHKAGNADMCLLDGFHALANVNKTPKGKCKLSGAASPALSLSCPASPSPRTTTKTSGAASTPTPDILLTDPEGRQAVAMAMKAEQQPIDSKLAESYLSFGSSAAAAGSVPSSSDPNISPHQISISQTPVSVELQDMTRKSTGSSGLRRTVTALQLRRQQHLLDFVNKEEVVLTSQAVMHGLQLERSVKTNEQVACRKTVVRAMQHLAEKGHIQCVKTSTEAPSGNRTSMIAWVSNALDPTGEEVPRRLRLLLPMTREDPVNEVHGERQPKKRRTHKKKPRATKTSTATEDFDDANPDSDNDDPLATIPELSLYSKHQKMQRLRIFHIYLFRLMYGSVVSEAGEPGGDESDVNSVVNNFPWLEDVGKVTDSTATPGSMNCYDSLVNMPFSLYFQLFGSIEQCPRCIKVIAQPEYTYKALKHLPRYLFEEALGFNKRHTEAFRNVTAQLQLLEVMGLVKLKDENKMLKAREFTLCSDVSIVDTTLVEVGGYMLLDPELTKNLPVYRHHLTDVFATVRFWYSVEDICRRTPLGSLHMKEQEDVLRERLKAEGVKSVHRFYSRDYLHYPETCIGAAGYPPDFFAHRFWLLNSERKDRKYPLLDGNSSVETVSPSDAAKSELFDSLTADDLEGLDPDILKEILQEGSPSPAKKPSTRSSRSRSAVETVSGKASQPNQGGRGQKRTRQGSSETPSGKRAKKSKDKEPSEVDAPTSAATGTAGLPQAAPKITASGFVKLSLSDFKINMDVQSTGLPTKKGTSAEPEDLEALSRMVKLRIAYTPAEDQYVLCHHVASCYLRCLGLEEATWQQCRDGIHKALEESRDKSSGSLYRRVRYLLKRQTVVRDCRVSLIQILQSLQTAVQAGEKFADTYDEIFPIILLQDKTRPQGTPKLTDTLSELHEKYDCLDIDNSAAGVHHWACETEDDIQLCVVADVIQATTKAAMTVAAFNSLDAFSTLDSFNSKLLDTVFDRFTGLHILKRMRYKEKLDYKRTHGHFPHAFNGFILTSGYFDLFEDRTVQGYNLANARSLHDLLSRNEHVSVSVTASESMFNAYSISGESSESRAMAPARKKPWSQKQSASKCTDPNNSDQAESDTETGSEPAAKRLCAQPSATAVEAQDSTTTIDASGDAAVVCADKAPSIPDSSAVLLQQVEKPTGSTLQLSAAAAAAASAMSGDAEAGHEVESDGDDDGGTVQDEEDEDDGARADGGIGEPLPSGPSCMKEDHVRMGAFHCFASLLASEKITVDARLPECSINQKASAVGTLGAENVWRGLAYNVLEAVQGSTSSGKTLPAGRPVSTSGEVTPSPSTSQPSKKKVTFADESDPESSDEDEDSLSTPQSSRDEVVAGDGEPTTDVSNGLSRVLGLSDTNVVLKSCQVDMYSSVHQHLPTIDESLLTSPEDDVSQVSCWLLGQSESDRHDCQRVRRYFPTEPDSGNVAVDVEKLYQTFKSRKASTEDCRVGGTNSDEECERFRSGPCPCAQPSSMPLAVYFSTCKQQLRWSEGDLLRAEYIYNHIAEAGWKGVLIKCLHNMQLPESGSLSAEHHVDELINFQLVLLAGVHQPTAVAMDHARCWMSTSSVNSRATGVYSSQSSSQDSSLPAAASSSTVIPGSDISVEDKSAMDADTSKQDSLSASSSDVQSTPINPTEAATSAGEGKTRSAALRDVGKKPAHLRRRPVHADAQPVVEKSATLAGSSGKPRQMMFPSRPWLSLEGIPQSQSTEQMLFGVARLIATQPGITQSRLYRTFSNVLRPTVVDQLIDNLLKADLVERRFVQRSTKPSLFSQPSVYTPATGGDGGSDFIYFVPTPNCMSGVSELL